jgi:hypothetical protein
MKLSQVDANAVSAFDGFGREICMQKSADIHYQNISRLLSARCFGGGSRGDRLMDRSLPSEPWNSSRF